MEKEPIRIAQMMTDMNFGGVEMVVMNYYRHIDRSKVQFDFFVLEGSTLPQREEIEQLGGRIFIVPKYTQIFQYEKAIQKIFKENNYKIVHSHMNVLSVLSLFGAKKSGVKIRIVHNHSTAGKGETKKNILKYILRPFSKLYPTHLCACTYHAGKWLYGKRASFRVFNNAIELNKFKFDKEKRKSLRKEIGLDNKFVIGHIGRFCYQKNQEFLIDVFYDITKKKENATLILIGEGNEEVAIKEKVKVLGLDKKVLFLGSRPNIYDFYQVMDCFVLPSRYEGLGMVAIEAQAAGLPVVCSTEVPDETKVTELVTYLSLSEDVDIWAKEIINKEKTERKDMTNVLKDAGYEISVEAEKLFEYYESLV